MVENGAAVGFSRIALKSTIVNYDRAESAEVENRAAIDRRIFHKSTIVNCHRRLAIRASEVGDRAARSKSLVAYKSTLVNYEYI